MELTSSNVKVVVFRVGTEQFGIDIDQVISIERMQPITSVPKMMKHVLGVINLREVVTPVVDLRTALSDGGEPLTDETTRVIVVKMDDKQLGLVVDDATDVLDIPSESIQRPSLPSNDATSFLQGISKLDDRLIILIDVQKLVKNIAALDDLKQLVESI